MFAGVNFLRRRRQHPAAFEIQGDEMSTTGTTFDIEVIAASAAMPVAFHDGAAIFRPGEAGDCAYIVKSGHVEMRERGRAVQVLKPGEIFGELSLLDHQPHAAAAIASGPVELLPIDRAMFEVLMRDDPDFALTVAHLLARSLRATMRLLESCVEDLQATADDQHGASRRAG
jgi:CRP/FNR family transcriptional regulator, cyclic AMP receptor protein